MRKALMGLVLAATVLTPVAASAQGREGRNRHEQREDNAGGGQDASARQEARQERREARQAARQQMQPREASPALTVQVAQRGEGRRGDDGRRGGEGRRGGDGGGAQQQQQQSDSGYQRGWQGPPGTENSRIADRYNRRAQENAIRNGTPAQRRDAIEDARRDGRSREQVREWRREGREDRRDDRREWRDDRRDDRRDWRQDRRQDRRDWNRGWRSDNRYNWQDWRYRNRSLFRLPPYYAPYRGYGYSRFSVGRILDRLFYDQRYWLTDPSYYRLPYAPYGTQWVRYYNDVLLVDVYTGEVIDVIYDFFW